jgi:hypothetical protein
VEGFWALAGVVGGIVATGGSIFVMRRERRRIRRIRRIRREELYTEKIPNLLAHLDSSGTIDIEDEVRAMRNTAAVASKADAARANRAGRAGELALTAHGLAPPWSTDDR